MKLQAEGRWLNQAIETMLRSNREAGIIARDEFSCTSCTDVTGFGLLGHLIEMMKASGDEIGAVVRLNELPVLDGVLDCMRLGIFSSLQPSNIRLKRGIVNEEEAVKNEIYPILFDPQTAGGLLLGVDAAQTADCLARLKEAGYTKAAVIGKVKGGGNGIEIK